MSTTLIAPPDRSLIQRMTALQRANEIRFRRAELKRDLKRHGAMARAGNRWADPVVEIIGVLLDPPDYVETMRLFDLLLACPKWGRVKVNRILRACGVSPGKTIGGLSSRQKQELIGMLGGRR